MLIRTIYLAAILGLIATACGGESASGGVASVTDIDAGVTSSTTSLIANDPSDDSKRDEPDTEQALLDLAACMRDEGIEMEDPQIGSDGNIRLGPIIRQAVDSDPEEIRAALDACSEHLEGVTLGFRDFNITELQDQMLEFAGCMRENGFDMPDPDFSNFAARGGGGPGDGPFGEIDPRDPSFESAFAACQDVLSFGRFGGGGSPGSSRSGG